MPNLDRIQPYAQNPFYWQHKGRPVLLLGGSREDNLFQIPDIAEHLALLAAVGGNYVRCTMSSRDPGDVWPFEQDPQTGLYDLARPGVAYWERFRRFLDLTAAHDIIVQIEMWDRFDFAREPWQQNPYNPRNNVNYTEAASGLKPEITTHPGRRESAFFRTVPALDNNPVVLPYQRQQVDALLDISLPYDHVLYCMDNETNESPEWGRYWSETIKRRARQAGVTVCTTEMWDDHDLLGPEHANTLDHPELYDFIDVSQNNHQVGFEHWQKPQEIRNRIIASGHIGPLNAVKIYGANTGQYGTSRDAQERFWRNVFGGLASSRFHRPPSGLGLDPIAQAHIRSMRMLMGAFDVFTAAPHTDLVSMRSRNEAYCIARPGTAYAVFFPDGGDIRLNVFDAGDRPLTVRWLEIRASRWSGDPVTVSAPLGSLRLVTPTEEGYWAALVKVGA